MKIIAQKTEYNSTNIFFNETIKEEYVDGIGLNVIYIKSSDLLIYSPSTTVGIDILNLEKNSVANANLKLEDALEKIDSTNIKKEVMLNLVPVNYSVVDDVSLKRLVEIYRDYIKKVDEVIKKYPNLDIRVYSINSSLITIAKEVIKTRKLGFYLYGGDLNPIDVDFYVFTPFMINDDIFEQLLNMNKEIYITITNNNELGLVTNHYSSKYSTAQSQKILPALAFIIAQPNLIERIFRRN